jgi:Na+/melibiose symporter-like transporter
MYWLTLISSVLGILSFIFYFVDYFKQWRQYLLHLTFGTVGLALGLLLSMTQTTVKQFSQSQLVYLIAFVVIMAFLFMFVHRYLTKGNDSLFVVIIVVIGISYLSVRLLNSVEASQSFIKSSDYLILSSQYSEKGDYARAADFLQKYRDIETINLPDTMLDSLDRKIKRLRYKGFENIK